MNDEPRCTALAAARVANGEHVDWDEAFRSASDDRERGILHQLRLVESVARAHGGVDSDGTDSTHRIDDSGMAGDARHPDARRAPRSWGHLDLREKLGEGAFGEVFLAWDRRLERELALKLLKADESREPVLASNVIEEARLLAKLRHPHVVTVFGAETHDGRVGLWMDFIRGRSLEQLVRDQGPFGAREAALIGIDLGRALAAVHRAGVIHRDVKAQNVMREEGGRIVLMDFGAGVDLLGGRKNATKSISGTPLYMAPEMLRGEPATQRADIYSLGVLLYRLVTGSFPIEAASWGELRDKHARHEAKLLRDQRSDLPEAFVKVVERALATDPAERFATAGQMEQSLSLALGVEKPTPRALPPDRKHRILRFAVAAIVIVSGITLLLVARHRGRREIVPAPAPRSSSAEREPAPSTAAASTYTIEASLYRVSASSSVRERLELGSRLALHDRLTLEFNASAPLHVYVIDEDDAGHAYALFPMPGLAQQNPLAPGRTHILPGSLNGKDLSWTVDSPGGHEHVMVLASPERLSEFEAEMSALARPGQTAVAIPESAKAHLRGIGGLAEAPVAGGEKSAGHLFEMAQSLASRSEVVNGVWMRRIDLESPRPK